jgi:hypothetical protein
MKTQRPHHVRIIADPVTALPILSAGLSDPLLRSKDVEAILANFP